jgi:hypothetical protein
MAAAILPAAQLLCQAAKTAVHAGDERYKPKKKPAADCRNTMSPSGQKQTWPDVCVMSALPPKADIWPWFVDVRFGPIADMREVSNGTSTVTLPSLSPLLHGLGVPE